MIPSIRAISQQLAHPDFNTPGEIVSWMGAVQAQDYAMSKWAVGIRSQSSTIRDVDMALQKGEILRTHIMRPTWHLVTAEDIRWMLKLSVNRLRNVLVSYSKYLGITEDVYTQTNRLMERILGGNKHLTRQEVMVMLNRLNVKADDTWANCIMMRAEIEGIVCSGIDQKKKQTYALLEERVPPVPDIHKEEALAKLAQRYFQSHSPASAEDFCWWSGLSLTEARQAIKLIESELISGQFEDTKLYIHETYKGNTQSDSGMHLLPAYDEYLISYKNRTDVLDLEYHRQAFSTNGIFHPVILYKNRIIGNWKKSIKKGEISIEVSFFEKQVGINKNIILLAGNKYKNFMKI